MDGIQDQQLCRNIPVEVDRVEVLATDSCDLDNISQEEALSETMHKDSCMCSKSELDLFSIPPTQVVMEKGFWEDVDPITSISSSDTIEFLCAANSGVYTDFASSYLYVKAKITTAAGGNVGADIQVGPSNLWMHALFS